MNLDYIFAQAEYVITPKSSQPSTGPGSIGCELVYVCPSKPTNNSKNK